jgi:hypothetical protein
MGRHSTRGALGLIALLFWAATRLAGESKPAEEELLSSVAPRLRIEISPAGMRTLRAYQQIWGQPRPQREDVSATVWEGETRYTNVAIHLKGSFTFEPVDQKPSLTLHFDKFAPGQRFHGLAKIHLNNSVQDRSWLCEQLARELFATAGVASPRAGHALVRLNGRDLGLYVVIEGMNKTFLKRHFDSVKGNCYDGGSGGDITKALKATSGENPDDRSDLEQLAAAARILEPAARLAALRKVLDLDEFISFAATEAFIVHWDGYCIGGNNYHVFHDASRDKMVFIPHGMDQLFGVSSSPALSITPPFKGMVARAVFSTPEGRQLYLDRLRELSTNEFRLETVQARVDRLAAQLRNALVNEPDALAQLDEAGPDLKRRIAQRALNVGRQLRQPAAPLQFAQGKGASLKDWSFKGGITQPSNGSRELADGRQTLRVTGSGLASSGSWRATVFLAPGHYEFTGLGRTEGLLPNLGKSPSGVILRISGERATRGISVSSEWKPLSYEFNIRGAEEVELVCEFRGQGSGLFDSGTLRLILKGPPTEEP